MFSRRLTRPIAIGATVILIAGGTYGIVSATASTNSSAASTAASTSATSGKSPAAGGGSNARSGPAAGGSYGKIDTISTTGFTLSTPTGQKVTVKETSSTKYEKGTTPGSATVLKKGENVLVLGTTSSTTITASQVIAQPTDGVGSTTPAAAGVVAFKRGASTTSKQVGQIPAAYKQGSGTLASGTTANRATVASLAAYPGAVVDRVVELSNGDYEVHNIGVNWPHHVFVNADFKFIGAN